MARHRKSEANPLVGIAVAIALLISVILYAALFVLEAVLTIGLYVLPFVAIYAPLFIRTVSQNPPELPNTEAFECLDEEEEIIRLLTIKYEEEINIEEQYEIGRGSNILLTKATNQTRFDTRSKKGRMLNQDIDESEKIIASVMEEVKSIRRNVYRSIPEWSKDYREWINNRSLYYASRQGIWCFSISAVALYFISFIDYKNIQEFITGTGGILLWKPGKNVLLEPLAVSAAISYVVFGIRWKLEHKKLTDVLEGEISTPWRRVMAKWNPYNKPEYQFRLDDNYNIEEKTDDQSSENNRWFEILGVNPEATLEEIKQSYHNAMKEYHPDRVSGLGKKLRDLAEEEAKKINAAYDEARSQRGFA